MKTAASQQAQGQLITAVSAGGMEALWRMAGKPGPVGNLAREALEKLTEPSADYSPMEAVSIVIRNKD